MFHKTHSIRNSRSPVARTRKIKILLADSEGQFATTLADRLRLLRFTVRCATTAAETISEAESYRPDVLLIGSAFADMSGNDLLVHCKTAFPTTAAILLPDHGAVDTAIVGMERGADDFLMKPIDLSILAEKISEVHSRRKSRAPRQK
jgi:DNA-binding response OmpR family regulator